MKQEFLLEEYKRKLEEESYERYGKPSVYFKSAYKYYLNLQDGIANEDNFFENTMTIFTQRSKPKTKPDFVSDSGSRYWYSKSGVIRGSAHWGNGVYNCDWALHMKNGKTTYGVSFKAPKQFPEEVFGFSKWEDFVFKAKLIEIADKEYITTFNNVVGRDLYKIGKKKYQKVITIKYEEV